MTTLTSPRPLFVRLCAVLLACVLVTGVAVSGTSRASTNTVGFTAVVPERVVDTRSGLGGSTFGSQETRTFSFAGLVPSDATGVALNVTAVDATSDTYVTVWPAGQPQPYSSNVNVQAGQTRPNAVLVGLGAGGDVSVYVDRGDVDVLVDVMGFFVGEFEGVRPTRVLDTRTGLAGSRMGAGDLRDVRVAGVAGVPADASAVAVNVTAVDATEATFLTVFPYGSVMPDTSNLNVDPALAAVPNLAVVRVGDGGRVSVFNSAGSVDAIVDVMGYFTAGGSFVPAVSSTRLMDTRVAGPCMFPLGPGEVRRVRLASVGSSSAALNVTAVDATEATFLTVYPAGAARPDTSTVNVPAGPGATPNFVMVGAGAANEIAVYNDTGWVHVVVDEFGARPGQVDDGIAEACNLEPGDPADPGVPGVPNEPNAPDTSNGYIAYTMFTGIYKLLDTGETVWVPYFSDATVFVSGTTPAFRLSHVWIEGCVDDLDAPDRTTIDVETDDPIGQLYQRWAYTREVDGYDVQHTSGFQIPPVLVERVSDGAGCESPWGSVETKVTLSDGSTERRRVPLYATALRQDAVPIPYPDEWLHP